MSKDLEALDKKDAINETPQESVSKKEKASDTPDEIGYLKITVEDLPSKGLFYPNDIYIGVKAAGVQEIKHWSMIDDRDDYSFIQACDFVLSTCSKIKTKGKLLSSKDLCEVDRLYLIFAIREQTFPEGDNDVIVNVPYNYQGQEYSDKVPVTKEKLGYFSLPEKLMKLYDEGKRAFLIKGEHDFEVRLPSVGIAEWVQGYLGKKYQEGKPVDEFFAKAASFIFTDYENLTDKDYFNAEVDSKGWGARDVSAIDRITQILSEGARQGFTHKTRHGGSEVTVPLVFQDGVKSIFIISDVLGDLG